MKKWLMMYKNVGFELLQTPAQEGPVMQQLTFQRTVINPILFLFTLLVERSTLCIVAAFLHPFQNMACRVILNGCNNFHQKLRKFDKISFWENSIKLSKKKIKALSNSFWGDFRKKNLFCKFKETKALCFFLKNLNLFTEKTYFFFLGNSLS